jgi:hypothetical protein
VAWGDIGHKILIKEQVAPYVPHILEAISSEFPSRSAGQLSSASASISFTVSFSQARSNRRSTR